MHANMNYVIMWMFIFLCMFISKVKQIKVIVFQKKDAYSLYKSTQQ